MKDPRFFVSKTAPFGHLVRLMKAVLQANGCPCQPEMLDGLRRLENDMARSAPDARCFMVAFLVPIIIKPKWQRHPDERDSLTAVVERLLLRYDQADLVKLRIAPRPLRYMREANRDRICAGIRTAELAVELDRLRVRYALYHDTLASLAMHLIAGAECAF